MSNPLGVYAHPNKKYHDALLQKVYAFYDEVIDMLSYMKRGTVPSDKECAWVNRALFGTCPACITDRSNWIDKHIKQLERVMQCKPGWNCQHLIYCPDCLANWRYTHAATIREMKKQSSDLRLILRRESFVVPRGVYDAGWKRGLLIHTNINPIYDLPRNDAWYPYMPERVRETERLTEFRENFDSVSDVYDEYLLRVWDAIGGRNTVERPSRLKDLSCALPEDITRSRQLRFEHDNLIKNNIRKGISDYTVNPLIAELLARATAITKRFRNIPGYIHRVIVVPPNLKDSVVMLRLDSLFLAPRRIYDRLKNEGDEDWVSNKHYENRFIHDDPTRVWSFFRKVTTNCRVIPDDIHALLALLENRFPYTGNWFTGFLPQEFPFYMNCYTEYHFHRTAGVFTRRA